VTGGRECGDTSQSTPA